MYSGAGLPGRRRIRPTVTSSVTRLLIDPSVLIKWFHDAGESELAAARAIRDAHIRGDLDAHVLDLAMYEVGNVRARALGWAEPGVIAAVDELVDAPARYREVQSLLVG